MASEPQIELTDQDKAQLNDLAGVLSFVPTGPFRRLLHSQAKITCLFTGNQFGKTNSVAMDYVHRILGTHPNPAKNIMPGDQIRTFRFASETLPTDEASEVKNTQYPAFKRWLPPSLIKKDITIRKPVMTIKSPLGGKDVFVEFVSYSQEVQATAGVQRRSVWLDENGGVSFFEEQLPRLVAADGDLIMTYTPVPGASGWEFDSLYNRASAVYRSPAVRKRIYSRTGELPPTIERREGAEDIFVIMAATDDNPTLKSEAIDALMRMYDDEDVIDARRYGLFRQLSGLLYKDFQPRTHVVSRETLFPEGVPHEWRFARGIDYHQHNNWAIVWLAVSPRNEIFVYDEWNPSPDKFVTLDIAKNVAAKSGDYKFSVNLIDPLASQKQTNTGFTTLEDLNRIFYEFRKDGFGTGGYWQGWDTRNTRGMDEVRTRLKNSLLVGRPFNNEQRQGGRVSYLPTIWFASNCAETITSFKNWRWDEWANRDQLLTKDVKEQPMQKYSHFCRAVECLLKDSRLIHGAGQAKPQGVRHETPRYMMGA